MATIEDTTSQTQVIGKETSGVSKMKVIAYQFSESEDMLIVDVKNNTAERQDKEGTILWRELFLNYDLLAKWVESMIQEGKVYGSIV